MSVVGRAVVLALALAGACDRASGARDGVPQQAPRVADPIARPHVELAGCRHVDARRCHVEAGQPSTLVVWIDVHARAGIEVTIDGAPRAIESRAIDGGQQLRIEVPAAAERLAITGTNPPWREPFELEWVRETPPAAVKQARLLVDAGEIAGARACLVDALDDAEGLARLDVLQLLWRTYGYEPEALRYAEDAAALAEQLGRSRDLADVAAGAVFIELFVRDDRVAARRWLDRLAKAASASPSEGELALDEARVWSGYYGGLYDYQSGELGDTLHRLDAARRGARRLDMIAEFLVASEQLGPALAELGRGDEALAVLSDTLALVRTAGLPCSDRARALGNLAWAHLLLARAGLAHEPPMPLLDEQRSLVEAGGECPDPTTAAYARVNAMLAALAQDEPEEAWELLGELEIHDLPDALRPWVDEGAAQVGLATGRWSLLPEFVEQPDPGGEPGLRFTALVRQAETLERLGFVDAAIDGYARAEVLLDATLASVGIDIGRELFLAGRQVSALALVELLIGQGRVDEALCRARLARGRALRSLDRAGRLAGLSDDELAERERLLTEYRELREQAATEQLDDWRFSAAERAQREGRRRERLDAGESVLDVALREVGGRDAPPACSDLAPLAAGELMIVQFPSRVAEGEGTRSWVFVADGRGVSVELAGTPSAATSWASAVLEHEAARIRAATLIRVLPTGSGWEIPFHALPLGEGVLLDAAPLAYALDLPARTPEHEPGRSALVIADPSEDLPHARHEAEVVVERLRAQGWALEHREGAAVTRSALAALLGEVSLFHYAGHGTHGGGVGWDAALVLHEGEPLGVGDILALPRVPSGVVLTGCDTATVAPNTLDGGMNLARAFVLAGARWVVAAEGKVDDELALTIGESLYPSGASPREFDAVAALRDIQLRLRRERSSTSWQAFRVVTP